MRKLLALALLTMVVAACVPPTVDGGDTTHVVFGDSLGAQLMGPGLTNDGQQWYVQNGATVAYWEVAIDEVLARPATTVVLALGGNEAIASDDAGWTTADQASWERVLAATPSQTCLVIVLPWFTQPAEDMWPGTFEATDRARAWMNSITRPNTVLADWRTRVEADPSIIDGVHLTGPAAAQVRYDMLILGEWSCDNTAVRHV